MGLRNSLRPIHQCRVRLVWLMLGLRERWRGGLWARRVGGWQRQTVRERVLCPPLSPALVGIALVIGCSGPLGVVGAVLVCVVCVCRSGVVCMARHRER